MEPGAAIKKARKEREWSQTTLAERIGVARGTVTFWETGRQYPIPAFRRQLKELLGVDLEYATKK